MGDNGPAKVIVEAMYGVACALAWGEGTFVTTLETHGRETYPVQEVEESAEDYQEEPHHPDRTRPVPKWDIWDKLAYLWALNKPPVLPTTPPAREDPRPKVESWLHGVSYPDDDPEDV